MVQQWYIEKAGDLSRLSLIELKQALVKEGEVRVQVHAVGLNFADIFALTGLYSATPKGGFVPGLEFAGIVSESKDARFAKGQRVMGCIRFGAYASEVVVAAEQLYALPDEWSFEQGAAFLVQTFTAYYALIELGAVTSQKLTLIQSAAGGVGLQALAICKALNVSTIATVSSTKKAEFLRARFATDVIVRDKDFKEQLQTCLQGRDLLVVLDAVGGVVQQQCFDALAPTGRLVVFGAAEFTPGKRRPSWLKMAWKYLTRPKYDALAMISDNKSVLAFNLIWLWQNQTLFSEMLKDIMSLELPAPHVGHRFHFEDAPGALECLRSGHSVGKVVLTKA